MAIHARATTARPSRANRAVCPGRTARSTRPITVRIKMGIRNGSTDSPYKSATTSGSSSKAASVSRIRLMTTAIIRIFKESVHLFIY